MASGLSSEAGLSICAVPGECHGQPPSYLWKRQTQRNPPLSQRSSGHHVVFFNSTVDENLLTWHNECWHKMITNPQGNQLQNPSYICEMLIIKKQKKTSVDLQNVWREIICTRPQVLVTKIKKYLFPTSCWGHRERKIFSRDFVLRSRSNKSISSWPNV